MEIVFIILFVGLMLALKVFWIWMIVHCACGRFPNDSEKILWLIVVIIFGEIGAFIYVFFKKNEVDSLKEVTIWHGGVEEYFPVQNQPEQSIGKLNGI